MNGFKKLVRLNLKVFGDGTGCTVHNKLKKIYVKHQLILEERITIVKFLMDRNSDKNVSNIG
jgi:hypothetical protein